MDGCHLLSLIINLLHRIASRWRWAQRSSGTTSLWTTCHRKGDRSSDARLTWGHWSVSRLSSGFQVGLNADRLGWIRYDDAPRGRHVYSRGHADGRHGRSHGQRSSSLPRLGPTISFGITTMVKRALRSIGSHRRFCFVGLAVR